MPATNTTTIPASMPRSAAKVEAAAEFDGHGRCSADPFFNGFDLVPLVKVSFHPNDLGHRAFADLVLAEITELP